MKHLKLFEEANDNLYYRKLTWDEQNYEWVGGFTSDRRHTWCFNKKDVLKVVSYFKDWDFYIKPCYKDKFELFILSEGTSLKWFCPDPKERKKIIGLDSTELAYLHISDIFIGGRMMPGYRALAEIHSYDDDYFTCSINDTNVDEFYECDQIEGLIKLLKDKGVINTTNP